MKLIPFIVLLLSLLFVGCGSGESAEIIPQKKTTHYINGYVIWTFVYDGCEYIGNGQSITHKGNCNNSIHKK